ncbi:MAG: hypothetical protein ACRDJN_31615 [Chloroflexota bacterium]
MSGESAQPILIGRLSPDRDLARHAAFALFVQVYLEQTGLAPRRFVPQRGGTASRASFPVEELPGVVQAITAQNPHVLASFADPTRAAALRTLDPQAAQELLGWLQAQHVDREEPQIAYELGMLALGAELPAIVVRGLRQAAVGPESRVAELPDGSGYPTVFLATLHPEWRAAEHARLFVEGTDAEQLAGWAMLLLARSLAPPPGSITRVSARHRAPLQREAFDLALVYNPVPWLVAPAVYGSVVRAGDIVLV